MIPETTEVTVRDTLPKSLKMAQDPGGARDRILRTIAPAPYNLAHRGLGHTIMAAVKAKAQPPPQPPQMFSQQAKRDVSSLLQKHSRQEQRTAVKQGAVRPSAEDYFMSLGLLPKGKADRTPMPAASPHEPSACQSSAEGATRDQREEGDVDMVALSPEKGSMYPVSLQAASPTHSLISTGGRRRTLSLSHSKPASEILQGNEDKGALHEGKNSGNAVKENDVIVIEDSEEEVNEEVASPAPANDGVEVEKEQQKRDEGKSKSLDDQMKKVLRKIPFSSPLFQRLLPVLQITTPEYNIIRSYNEYCKSNNGEKLRARVFPCSWRKTEPSWCHGYKFNKVDRREFDRVIASGLTKRSRVLLRKCKGCSVALKKLTTEDINKWRTRVVRKEIHYDDDLIMIVDEVITPSGASQVNPVPSQTVLSNQLPGSTFQSTPFLQEPAPGPRMLGCQTVRPASGQLLGFTAPRPTAAGLCLHGKPRKVLMKPKEVEKTFKGKEAGGTIRKTVYTPCQGELKGPMRNRGSHTPTILQSGGGGPHRAPSVTAKKSLPTLHPRPFINICPNPNPTLHLGPQPQPNSQPHPSSQQRPSSLLLSTSRSFENGTVVPVGSVSVLRPTPYLEPQYRTPNDMDDLLRQYNIIGSVQDPADDQMGDGTRAPQTDASLVYLQANPDGNVQYVNMPVSSMPFSSGLPYVSLSFPSIGIPGEPIAMGSGMSGTLTYTPLTPCSDGDNSQNMEGEEVSNGLAVASSFPQETSINLDTDEEEGTQEVIFISDDDA